MSNLGAGNVTVEFNSTDVSAQLTQASQEVIVGELEATTMTSAAEQKDPGLPGHAVEISGDWNKTIDDLFAPAAATPTKYTLAVTVGPSGGQVTSTWTTNAFVSNYRWEAGDPKGKITWSARFALSGNPTRS